MIEILDIRDKMPDELKSGKTCGTCIDNDNYLYDCFGIWVEDDDEACEKHRCQNRTDWKFQMMRTFLANH